LKIWDRKKISVILSISDKSARIISKTARPIRCRRNIWSSLFTGKHTIMGWARCARRPGCVPPRDAARPRSDARPTRAPHLGSPGSRLPRAARLSDSRTNGCRRIVFSTNPNCCCTQPSGRRLSSSPGDATP
jgi:hypothetical protein